MAVAATLDGGVGGMFFPGTKARRPDGGVVSDAAVCCTSFPGIRRRSDVEGSFAADDLH